MEPLLPTLIALLGRDTLALSLRFEAGVPGLEWLAADSVMVTFDCRPMTKRRALDES